MKLASLALSVGFCSMLAGCTPHVRFGSWAQTVKSTDVGSNSDDPAETLAVLQATNQSFIIYNIDSYDEFDDFLELLYAALPTKIDVYAAVDAPHLSRKDARLFDLAGIDPPDCDCVGSDGKSLTGTDLFDCSRTCIVAWLQAWKAAAAQLSELASMYHNLKGFVINDFDGYVESLDFPACRFGKRLSLPEVQEIRDAVRSHEGDLEFWPVCYPFNFGRVVGDGFTLGANYGVKIFPEDEMSVTFSFAIVGSLPQLAKFRFLHVDTVSTKSGASDCYGYNIKKRVLVNGIPAWSESVAGAQGVERWDRDIAELLTMGNNTVTLSLKSEADTETNGCDDLFWRCWDVSLERIDAGPVLPFFASADVALTPSYEVISDAEEYFPTELCYGSWLATEFDVYGKVTNSGLRCNVGVLPDSGALGRAATRLIAAPDTNYLIHNLVDGIVAPWYQTERPTHASLVSTACSEGPVWPLDASLETYRAVLESAVDAVKRSGLLVLHLGLPLGDSEYNLDVLRGQLATAAEIAGAVGVWNMANGVDLLSAFGGVFAERTPLTAYWPGRQARLSGWYQRWTKVVFPAGTNEVYVTVSDTRGPGEEGYVVWRIYNGAGTFAEELDVGTDNLKYGPFEVEVTGGVTLEVQLVGGVGDWPVGVTFDVTDSAGAAVLGWIYDSGVDPEVVRAFEVQRSVFLSEPGP